MTAHDLNDEELMRAVQAGNMDALGALFTRHQNRVYTLCYRLTNDAAAADDLTQECFLRILRYGHSFTGQSKFTTWLYRVVRNRCNDYHAGRHRDMKHQESFATDPTVERGDPLEDSEHPALLQEALDRLSPEKREILVLSRFENMKYREIAELCQESVGTIKVRAHRAMRELRRIFLDLEHER
jgi:RNA polymerase sigma-70 factor (ECF subfamily)